MTIRRGITATLAAVAISVSTLAAGWQAPAQKLQQAIDLIESKGDVARAVPLLEEVSKGSDKGAAALALLYLGKSQERSDRAQARRTYERIVNEFADQPSAASQARVRLASLNDDSARVSTERKVLSTTADLLYQSLVHDGAAVLFSDDDLSLLDLASGRVSKLSAAGLRQPGESLIFPVLSPDEKLIVCTRLAGQMPPVQADLQLISRTPGTKPRTLLSATDEIQYFKPVGWSPDGTSLVVELRKKDLTWAFARMNVADGRYQILKSVDWRRQNGGGVWRSTLSPDGRFLAYSAFPANPGSATANAESLDKHVYVLAVDGSVETDLTAVSGINENPVWTADGSHLLFLSNRSGAFDLWAVPMANGKPVAAASIVHRNIGRVVPIGMTRSGAYYYTSVSSGVPLLSVVGVDKAMAHAPAAAPPSDDFVGLLPSWSPDGKSIAFLRPRPGRGNEQELVIKTLSSGEERRYSTPEGATIGIGSTPLWFHDNQAVLLRVNFPGTPPNSSQALYRADLRSGSFTEMTAFGRFRVGGQFRAALSPDDTVLYTTGPLLRGDGSTAATPNGIVSADLRTGEQKTVFMASPARNVIAGLSLSPDGRTIAFLTFPGTQTLDLKTPMIHVARVETDGTGFRELAGPFVAGGAMNPAWSRDRRSILFAPGVVGDDGQLHAGPIMRIDAETGAKQPAGIDTAGLSSFALSPDGSRLVVGKATSGSTTEVRALEHVLAALKPRK